MPGVPEALGAVSEPPSLFVHCSNVAFALLDSLWGRQCGIIHSAAVETEAESHGPQRKKEAQDAAPPPPRRGPLRAQPPGLPAPSSLAVVPPLGFREQPPLAEPLGEGRHAPPTAICSSQGARASSFAQCQRVRPPVPGEAATWRELASHPGSRTPCVP